LTAQPESHMDGKGRCLVSVMVFTLNEEINLPSCLDSLEWCDDVIVIDSFSTDRTRSIAEAKGARFFQNAFTGFGDQRNWALAHCTPRHPWVLILDADERVMSELVVEMHQKLACVAPGVAAFRMRRRFYLWGRWLRYSSLYPTWVVRLIHRERVRYVNRGHAETQQVDGATEALTADLIDENLKGVHEWFERQNRYSTQDAAYELSQESTSTRWTSLFSRDVLTRRATLKRLAANLPGRTVLYFLYSYILRLGFLDGRDGLRFCQMKAMYQRMVTIKKVELRARQQK
jgi:glycosyltransferase involved in cell wall biosynthesis